MQSLEVQSHYAQLLFLVIAQGALSPGFFQHYPGDDNEKGVIDFADHVVWRDGRQLANETVSLGILNVFHDSVYVKTPRETEVLPRFPRRSKEKTVPKPIGIRVTFSEANAIRSVSPDAIRSLCGYSGEGLTTRWQGCAKLDSDRFTHL